MQIALQDEHTPNPGIEFVTSLVSDTPTDYVFSSIGTCHAYTRSLTTVTYHRFIETHLKASKMLAHSLYASFEKCPHIGNA